MASLFKKDRNKIRIINRYWYRLKKELGMESLNNKYIKDYDKNKESSHAFKCK